MRTYSLLCILTALAMLLIPACAVRERPAAEDHAPEASGAVIADGGETVKVFSSGDVSTVNIAEYVKGVVAAEIGAKNHTEAIKAQAVAAYTYALYLKNMNGENGIEKLGGADISDSPSTHQGYFDEEERRKRWGESFEENEKKLDEAISGVLGKYLSWNGAPAMTAYHDLCSGRTQAAETLWGSPYPYLVSVPSPGDKLSPAFSSEVTFTEEEFMEKAAELIGTEPEGDADKLLKITAADDGGYVETAKLGEKAFSGDEIRKAFGLKSTAFTVGSNGDNIVFTVLGSGHGVGMSQYGADYMARQGSTFEEILFHYYPGTVLESP